MIKRAEARMAVYTALIARLELVRKLRARQESSRYPDHFVAVTNDIIALMESADGKWEKPWHGMPIGLPCNISSGRTYNGINILLLWLAARDNDFQSMEWGTFRQWKLKGGHVRRGEKATRIVLYKQIRISAEPDDPEVDDDGKKTVRMAKTFTVFNRDQVGGLPVDAEVDLPDLATVDENCERFVAATGATIRHGGVQASYNPRTDQIQMPPRAAFVHTDTADASAHYYATLFHEMGHYSGREDRCNRDLSGRFGSEAYAVEELVAELTSAFLSAQMGLEPKSRADHAIYLKTWLKVLKQDNRAIFAAAAEAAKAVTFLNAQAGHTAEVPGSRADE